MFTRQNFAQMLTTINRNLKHCDRHLERAIKTEGGGSALRKWGPQVAALATIHGMVEQGMKVVDDPLYVVLWFGTFHAYINQLRTDYGEGFVQSILGDVEQYAPTDIKTPAIPSDVSTPAPQGQGNPTNPVTA